MNILSRIAIAISSAYHDPEHPTFFFKDRVLREQPYKALVYRLRHSFDVEDETDLNADAAFVLILRQGHDRWVVSLSMVGPFATIHRVQPGSPEEDATPPGPTPEVTVLSQPGPNPAERLIFEELADGNVTVLSQDILEQPVSLRLNYTEPQNVRVYQALFTDTDVLPWTPRKHG